MNTFRALIPPEQRLVAEPETGRDLGIQPLPPGLGDEPSERFLLPRVALGGLLEGGDKGIQQLIAGRRNLPASDPSSGTAAGAEPGAARGGAVPSLEDPAPDDGGVVDGKMPVPEDGLLPPVEWDLASRYLRIGFESKLAEGEMVVQVVNWWRNALTGEVVATPDPSYRPLDEQAWIELGPDWAGEDKGEPPVAADPPVNAKPPAEHGGDDAASGDGDGAEGGLPARDDGLPPEGIVPGYLRHGFKSVRGEDDVVAQVIMWWKNAATGEIVWAPDPSFQPPESTDWLSLGSGWPWAQDAQDKDPADAADAPARGDPDAAVDPPVKDGADAGADADASGSQRPVKGDPATGEDGAGDGKAPVAEDGLLPPVEWDLASRYLRIGFESKLAEGEMVAQVVNWWRNALTGEVVATPDPSYRPIDPDSWLELGPEKPDPATEDPGKGDPAADGQPPTDKDPDADTPKRDESPEEDASAPVDAQPQPAPELELVAYHWKTRAVLERTSWRVAEEIESIVGEPLPRLFQPVFEEDATGGRRLGLRRTAADETSAAPIAPEDASSGSIGQASAAADDGAVNLRDAVAILKIIAGMKAGGDAQAPSAFQSIAADFDGNSAVGLADALGVLRHAVGRGGPKPAWAFVDEADPGLPGRAGMHPGHLPDLSARLDDAKGKVGLVGVLRGDVDGSWTPPQALERLPDTWFGDLAGRVGARLSEGDFDPTRWGVYAG
jgi:hypothetical protein